MKNKKGFTIIEMIFSLLIVSISTILLTLSISILNKINVNNYLLEDECFIKQMQLLFVLSSDHNLEGDMLSFNYKNNYMYYVFENNKLILKDGYQIFLNHVRDVYFTKSKGCIYINYEREKQYKRIIGCP